MLFPPSGPTRAHFRVLIVALLALASASLPARPAAVPETITVLDSLTGDSTIAEGKVVYVDFWASWCVPCRLSFPWMAELLGRYQEQGLQIVTINLDRKRASAEKFLGAIQGSLPVVYDPKGELARLYDLQVMPTSFVYGRDGTLRSRREGFNPAEKGDVESLIRTLLEEKPAK